MIVGMNYMLERLVGKKIIELYNGVYIKVQLGATGTVWRHSVAPSQIYTSS